jgi:transcriptional regulator GlxA family with amidase domain
MSSATKPVNYGIVLFPGFQILDAFGPLDVLNLLAVSTNINLSVISSALDPVSSKPPSTVTEFKNKFSSNCSQQVVPTHTFETVPSLDVLIVPGGWGTRAPEISDTVAFIRKVNASGCFILSVCTGARLLADAGCLDGKQATTNKLNWDSVVQPRPQVKWIRQARWVADDNIWTASGITAGIDMMLSFVGEIYGENVAEDIANQLEHIRQRDSTVDPFCKVHTDST